MSVWAAEPVAISGDVWAGLPARWGPVCGEAPLSPSGVFGADLLAYPLQITYSGISDAPGCPRIDDLRGVGLVDRPQRDRPPEPDWRCWAARLARLVDDRDRAGMDRTAEAIRLLGRQSLPASGNHLPNDLLLWVADRTPCDTSTWQADCRDDAPIRTITIRLRARSLSEREGMSVG